MINKIILQTNKDIIFVKKTNGEFCTVTVKYKNHKIMEYRFLDLPFYHHNLLNWDNLNCCGGWEYDKLYLSTAVQDGKKPFSSLVEIVNDNNENSDIKTERLMSLYEAVSTDFDKSKSYTHFSGPNYKLEVNISRKEKMSELFNIDEILNVYNQHLNIIPLLNIDYIIEKLNKTPMELSESYQWASPDRIEDIILTGLLLGYPIESTIGIL